jgi:hypothetical protein
MAQQKYIEVTVSDTVLVKPDLFIYKILLSPDEDLSDFLENMRNQAVFDLFTIVFISREVSA